MSGEREGGIGARFLRGGGKRDRECGGGCASTTVSVCRVVATREATHTAGFLNVDLCQEMIGRSDDGEVIFEATRF